MPWYRQGTASVTINTRAVTGTTTGWLSQATAGDGITFNGGNTWYEIASVNSNTSITLATDFLQATVTGGAYAIDRRSTARTLSGALHEQLSEMIARSTRINTGSGAPSNSLGVDGDFYFRSDVPTLHGPKAGGVWPSGVPWTGGVPVGGTAGQILEKTSASDYAAAWVSPRWSTRNLIINARMNINQRGFAGGALAQDTYGWDRWKAGTGGAVVSVANDVITQTSGRLVQVVEAAMWDRWALQPMVFSVTDLSGNLSVVISLGAQTYNTTLTAGSGQRAFNFLAVNSGANITIDLRANAGEITYKWPVLEFGTVPSAWRARPLAEEIDLCERYTQIWGGQGGSTAQPIAPGFVGAVNNTQCVLMYRRRVRAVPSVTVVGNVATDFRLQVAGNNFLAPTSIVPLGVATTGCAFNVGPSSNLTLGHATALALNGSAGRIIVDAEI
jgi:hypothetical protein